MLAFSKVKMVRVKYGAIVHLLVFYNVPSDLVWKTFRYLYIAKNVADYIAA